MKAIQLFLSFFLLLFTTGVLAIIFNDSPEKLLIGDWKEVGWQFEKVNHNGNLTDFSLSDLQKEEIYSNLIFHEAEVWKFTTDHHLALKIIGTPTENLYWNMKGRGNILELRHRNNSIENFEIQSLTEDTLIIHFSFDLQIKGIIKMTFKRETVYA
jgi:hypothetical protein